MAILLFRCCVYIFVKYIWHLLSFIFWILAVFVCSFVFMLTLLTMMHDVENCFSQEQDWNCYWKLRTNFCLGDWVALRGSDFAIFISVIFTEGDSQNKEFAPRSNFVR